MQASPFDSFRGGLLGTAFGLGGSNDANLLSSPRVAPEVPPIDYENNDYQSFEKSDDNPDREKKPISASKRKAIIESIKGF